MQIRQYLQKRDSVKSATDRVSNPLASRPFAPQPKLANEPQPKQTFEQRMEIIERAARSGHSLSRMNLDPGKVVTPQPLQMKLAIGAPGDKYEQEADRVARQVVSQLHGPAIQQTARDNALQRAERGEDDELMMKPKIGSIQRMDLGDEDDELMRKPLNQRLPGLGGMAASPDLEQSINRERGKGQLLAETIRQPMEQAFGADFSSVKIHADVQSDQLNQSIQARAFTTGQDVFFRQGAYQPGSRGGQELIAHELTHVVQQNGCGRQAGREKTTVSKKSDSDGVIQRMGGTFTPFSGGAKQAASLAGLTLDTLFEQGLQYAQGGTKGNSVNLEKMISDTGGGSAPGEPQDITSIKQYDAGLVRAYNQPNVATAMHAINHNFADPTSTNLRPENIFMGSARSNTQEHFYKVEKPIRDSMKQLTKGNAQKYETNIQANPPTPLTNHPNILAWNNPGLDIPGVVASPLLPPQADPLPNVTHVLDTTNLANVTAPWPKMIQYEVIPLYSYQAHPNFPQFLLDNIQDAQNLVDAANLQPIPRPDQTEIDNEVWAINRLKAVGHNLFPKTFTCKAIYWFPSYDPAQPWYISSEQDVYDAEA